MILYLLWAILPVVFFLCFLRGKARETMKARIPGKRHEDLLYQSIFCGLILAFTILFDQAFFAEWLEEICGDVTEPVIFHWLLYPFFLFLAAIIEPHMPWKKDEKEEEGKSKVKFITK